jgi:hypothetical protein
MARSSSRKKIEAEIRVLRKRVDGIKVDNAKELEDKLRSADQTSSGLLTIVKMVVEEQRQNRLILKSISENLARLEAEQGSGELYEQDDRPSSYDPSSDRPSKVQPLSMLDARILQAIQVKDIACADDIKSAMGYSGRNAASARLNKLHKQGLLERYQLGHRVYYRYAGKATETLIISPQ